MTSNEPTDDISILLWNATSGDWDVEIRRPVGDDPYSIFIGDANNDGWKDIITGNVDSDDVSILVWIQSVLYIDIVRQLNSIEEFNITFSIYNEKCQGIDFATIKMWWNGNDISDNVVNLESGLYQVSLEPIFVQSGEDPILLNMTISALGYANKYFETYLAVEPYPDIEPCEIVKLLQVEITEHAFSLEHFNFTFFIFDETGQPIDSATIQM